MLALPANTKIWLGLEPVDMRKSFDGLCGVVLGSLDGDPYSGDVFVFFNRRRTLVKLMLWDGNGFWLFYKRLEQGTFEDLRATHAGNTVRINRAKLAMLLEGIDMKKSQFRNHYVRSIRIGGGDGETRDNQRRASG